MREHSSGHEELDKLCHHLERALRYARVLGERLSACRELNELLLAELARTSSGGHESDKTERLKELLAESSSWQK